jgi:hypothetical protein
MHNDYVPRQDAAFLIWVKNLLRCLKKNAAAWGIPPSSWVEMDELTAVLEVDMQKASDSNHGRADTVKKNDSRAALERAVRGYVKTYLAFNPALTVGDRAEMVLPIRKEGRQGTKLPESYPMRIGLRYPAPGVIELRVRDSESSREGKPPGVMGWEMRYVVLREPATEIEQLVHSVISTRNPTWLDLGIMHQGWFCTYAFRYMNRLGQKGPWSRLEAVVVA